MYFIETMIAMEKLIRIEASSRPSLAFSSSRKVRLALIGVDGVKLALHQRITGALAEWVKKLAGVE